MLNTEPKTITREEWEEIAQLPLVRASWGLDGAEGGLSFSRRTYGARFDFEGGGPDYCGDLYVLQGDVLNGYPPIVLRRDSVTQALTSAFDWQRCVEHIDKPEDHRDYAASSAQHSDFGEHINDETEAGAEWRCVCGNDPGKDGFFPCDAQGVVMEPSTGSNWDELFVCDRCGRIIDQRTLAVVGRRFGGQRSTPATDND